MDSWSETVPLSSGVLGPLDGRSSLLSLRSPLVPLPRSSSRPERSHLLEDLSLVEETWDKRLERLLSTSVKVTMIFFPTVETSRSPILPDGSFLETSRSPILPDGSFRRSGDERLLLLEPFLDASLLEPLSREESLLEFPSLDEYFEQDL